MSSVKFSISNVLGRAWELTKEHWLLIILFSIVAGMIGNGIWYIYYVSMIPVALFTDSSDQIAPEELKGIIIYAVVVYLFIVLVFALLCIGVQNMYLRASRGIKPDFSAFKLSVRTYLHCTLVYFIMFFISFVTIFYSIYCSYIYINGVRYFGGSDDTGIMLIAVVSLQILLFSCFIRFRYAPLLVLDNLGYGAWKALKASWQMTKGYFWRLLGLEILAGLIACSGLVVCCIGALFTSVIYGFAFIVSYDILKPRQHNDSPSPAPFRRPSSQVEPPAVPEAAPVERREQTPEEWIEAVLAAKEKEAAAEPFQAEADPSVPCGCHGRDSDGKGTPEGACGR